MISADFGIPARNDNHIRLAVTVADRESAIASPPMDWFRFERLYTAVRGVHLTYGVFTTTHLRDLDPDTVYTRQWGADLASGALYEYGAGQVDQSTFWLLYGKGAKTCPHVNSDSLAY